MILEDILSYGPLGAHMNRVLLSYLVWSVLARVVRQHILPKIWERKRVNRAVTDAELREEAMHRDKWMYDMWMFVVYTTMNVINSWLWISPWLFDSQSWGCYEASPDTTLEPTYAYVFGLYVHLLEWEIRVWNKTEEATKRRIYVVHHIVVLGLLALSWTHGWLRWGIVLILWHDIADPPLALAKMGVHMWGDDNFWSDVWFAVFVVAFTIPRLGWYPYYVLRQAYECLGQRFVQPPWGATATEWTVVVMLHILWACHLVWMHQIIRFASKKFISPPSSPNKVKALSKKAQKVLTQATTTAPVM